MNHGLSSDPPCPLGLSKEILSILSSTDKNSSESFLFSDNICNFEADFHFGEPQVTQGISKTLWVKQKHSLLFRV